MNIHNPPPLPETTKLPDLARAPWQPRKGDPAQRELLDKIALQNRRIELLEKLVACGDVVSLKPRLPRLPSRTQIARRALAQNTQHWPIKPMPARSLEPSPGGACFHLKDAGAKVIAFAVLGLSGAELENEVARIAQEQARQGNFIPVFLTDSPETESFRSRGYVFEYFPRGRGSGEAQNLEALQPRLELIESKWGVDLFINLGFPRGSTLRREMRPPRERYLEAKARFLGGHF